MSTVRVRRSRGLRGTLSVPGDKSISHRAVLLGALAEGETPISGFLCAEDTLNTARALQAMGVAIEGLGSPDMLVHGVGLRGLRAPEGALDLGNSGTGMRLLMGVLAGQGFTATLVGDPSLSRRPMDRIAAPLGLMGIRVEGEGERCTPPVTVHSGAPQPILYHSPVASAQVKSAVLLAGLHAHGTTSVCEPVLSRDHTERMLTGFGAAVVSAVEDSAGGASEATVQGPATLRGTPVAVPGDFSSAAYFVAAGLLCPDSDVVLRNVLLNPTRTGLLRVLARAGAAPQTLAESVVAGERVGDLRVRAGADLGEASLDVDAALIPALVDELPLLAVMATACGRTTRITGAAELRVKESDRIAMTVQGLEAMGAKVTEEPDGMTIHAPARLQGAAIETRLDHRIAMSFAIAGMLAEGETAIRGAECIATSFPGFVSAMRALGAEIQEDSQ
jgi:3-phosphoshikimate 1-carboxyvinyltransferase